MPFKLSNFCLFLPLRIGPQHTRLISTRLSRTLHQLMKFHSLGPTVSDLPSTLAIQIHKFSSQTSHPLLLVKSRWITLCTLFLLKPSQLTEELLLFSLKRLNHVDGKKNYTKEIPKPSADIIRIILQANFWQWIQLVGMVPKECSLVLCIRASKTSNLGRIFRFSATTLSILEPLI